MEPFIPKGTKIPTAGNYLKLAQGTTNIRVLSPAIVGWEYFNKDNKPVRSRTEWSNTPDDIKIGGSVKYFWAFTIWNYNENKVQIAEFTQKTILMPIEALLNNGKWGDIREYDITITKTGTTMQDTEYTVTPNPKEKLTTAIVEAYKAKKINLDALYDGTDPFGTPDPLKAYDGKVTEKINPDDIPF